MSQLSICLFGPPILTLDGRQVVLDRWKAVALLAYLAVEDRPHRRDGLVDASREMVELKHAPNLTIDVWR